MGWLSSFLRDQGVLPAKGAPRAKISKPSEPKTKKFDRWRDLKARASGMLHPEVYRSLYETAFNGPDLDIIEIGGAAGAGGIALALGLKESGKRSRVIVAEKLEGGSRSRVGDYATNLAIIERNIREFGVADHIVLFPHDVTWGSGAALKALVRTERIAALALDADGMIHRDFSLFWPMLYPGAPIIIDDYRDDPSRYVPPDFNNPLGGAKLVIAFRLANYMIERGLFRVDRTIGSTLIGTKPEHADISVLDRAECEGIVAGVLRERDEVLVLRASGG